MQDIRWIQRLNHYEKALAQLTSAVILAQSRPLSELEKQGLIQAFEFTHELSWNVMKDFFYYQGNSDITGSRDATREAFNKGLVTEGEYWMAMIKSRNQTSHTYNENIANEIVHNILMYYHPCFRIFLEKMRSIQPNIK